MRKTALVILFTLLVSSGTALSFGSYASQQEKEVAGSSASFKISVFNLADEPLELIIESSGAGDTEVIHPSSMTLEPATVTSDPDRGGDWFLLQDGRYVEVEEIPVEHFRGGSGSSQYSFDITLTAKPLDTSSDSSSQKIAQARTYSFSAGYVGTPGDSTPGNSNPGATEDLDEDSASGSLADSVRQNLPDLGGVGSSIERVFDGDSDTRDGSDNNQDADTGSGSSDGSTQSSDDESQSGSETGTTESQDDEQTSQNQSGLTGNFAGGANGITVVLLVAFGFSAFYLFRVM